MSESIERHITTVAASEDGTVTQVTHTSVRVSTSSDCFDPERCCDERERALIAAMRAYLRPQHAPDWTPLLTINKPSGLSHTSETFAKSGVR